MIWVLIIHTNSKGSEWFQDNVAARGVLKDTGQTGGGGVPSFFSYAGLGPASTVHPKKYQQFQAPQKNIWNFGNPKRYPRFWTLTFRKDPKMHGYDH